MWTESVGEEANGCGPSQWERKRMDVDRVSGRGSEWLQLRQRVLGGKFTHKTKLSPSFADYESTRMDYTCIVRSGGNF